MADPGKEGGPKGLLPVDALEKADQLRALSLLFGGSERGGYQAELMRLKDPEQVGLAIDVLSAVAIGLPTLRRTETVETAWVGDDDRLHLDPEVVEIIKIGELMQIFMSPDFLFDRTGAGYYARLALDQALDGTGRADVLSGLSGPGRFSAEEAVVLVKGRVPEGEEKQYVERIIGRLKPEALTVVGILAERAGEHKGRKLVWKAFAEHQHSGGDEKTGSEIFVTAGHAAPQGADWQALFDDRPITGYRETGRTLADGSMERLAVYGPGHRDRALRVIYAAGLTFEELIAQGKGELLIPGLHYEARNTRSFWEATDENAGRMEKSFDAKMAEARREIADGVAPDKRKWKIGTLPTGEEVLIKNMNIYAEGWGSDGFREWFGALEEATDGDLLAIYDSWYVAIVTGLVADVAVKGKKAGDPPLTSSLHAWLMHFGAKQANEAGYGFSGGELGARFRWNTYKGKTGPIVGIGRYPDRWLEPFFKNSKTKERVPAMDGGGNPIVDSQTGQPVMRYEERSIFELWWTKGRELATLNWVSTDRPDDSVTFGESEVALNSFDGWLYNQFQMYKMLAAVQGVAPLRDLAAYSYWEGMARSLDKAFGVTYLPIKDGTDVSSLRNQGERRADWLKNGGTEASLASRRIIVVDGVRFIQVVPDSENPRYQLVKGILSRYHPDWKNASVGGTDTAVAIADRFTHLSEKQIKEMVVVPGAKKPEMVGIPIELFIRSVVDAGLLTTAEAYAAVCSVYSPEIVESIVLGSEWLKATFAPFRPRRK